MKHILYNIVMRSVKIFNVLMITAFFALSWFFYYINCGVHETIDIYGEIAIILLFALLYILFTRVYDAFLVSVNRISEMILSQALAAFFSDCIIFVVLWLVVTGFPPVIPMLAVFGCQLFAIVIWCVIVHKLYFAFCLPQRSAVVYDSREGYEHLVNEYGFKKKFKADLIVEEEECLRDLSCINDMQTVFLNLRNSNTRNEILKYCIENQIQVYIIPLVEDVILSAAKQRNIFHLPMLRAERYNPNPEYLFFKRLFDIVSSFCVLLVVSPILLITAIAIKLCDRGPVFYKQCRLTKNGKAFNVLKFRSMRVDAEKDGVARLSTGSKDSRVTPVGKIIRKFRIDELPQLFNILGGSMSVVGPRPERPEIAKQYEEDLPEFRLRLQAKAGLTGYAQVYGKYNTSPRDKLRMDLMYISKPNFFTDLSLIFATIKILFIPESTEGVAEGQVTASVNAEQKEKQKI